MPRIIMGSMMSAVGAVIGFVVVKEIVNGQTTSSWSGAELAVVSVLPLALIVAGLFLVFKDIGGI